jgi:Putative Ig domain
MKVFLSKSLKIGVLLLAAAVAAGCGGGDGDSANTAPQNPGTTPPGGNSAPTISGQPGTSVVAGQAYTFQPAASDPNNDKLTFSATNLPAWATLNASTGRISGTPTTADIASYNGITLTVSDGAATASLPPFSITVAAVGSGSATLSWMPPTQNSDGSALTNLAGYEVRYGRSADELSQTVPLRNPSLSTYVVENLSSGTWFFAIVAVSAAGVTSAPSNVASKTIS